MIDRIRRFVDTGNAIRFLLSFILAFALWAWVTVERDPEQTFRASNIPIEVDGAPEGLELVGPLPDVDVTLQGPRSVIQSIDAGSISARVDLSGIESPGEQRVEVEVDVPDGIRRVMVDPEEIVVELDAVETALVGLEAQPPAEVPRNLTVTGITIEPETARVIGVQQNVERVEKVIVPVEIGNNTNSFTTEVTPVPIDQHGQPVSEVAVEPSVVEVGVDLRVRGKEVPVFVQWSGDAADGYAVIGQPQPIPSTVVIDGPRDKLEEVQFVYTTPIDTSALSSTTVLESVPLDREGLPDGVGVEPSSVNVSVRVEQAEISRTFENVPVQVLNATSDVRVSVNPATLSVTVEGPQEAISQLTDRDVDLVVDVTGLGVGVHQVRPTVALPPGIKYSEPPAEVAVGITAVELTPTPLPSPSPTATASP